eukprot:CAMPEP_0119521090 /NCGR_PEP_ID=MMETSP1344-20130328/36912_1 /TAXON_ID=236787 /ORGANISM="Florenciella parvula, Strain CCMP2471" /LENGTH=198 /DNA_ID=CAMNT_0007559033 /DNA_START=60 /DNA_END=653 /DNA_ORIENTATION=+
MTAMPTPRVVDFGPLDFTLGLSTGKLKSEIGALVDVQYQGEQTVLVDLSAATPRSKETPAKSSLLMTAEVEMFDTELFFVDMKMTMDKETSCGGMLMSVDEFGLTPRVFHSTDGLILMNFTGCMDEMEDMVLSAKTDEGERLVKGPMEEVMPWLPSVFGVTIPGRDAALGAAFDAASRAAVFLIEFLPGDAPTPSPTT